MSNWILWLSESKSERERESKTLASERRKDPEEAEKGERVKEKS